MTAIAPPEQPTPRADTVLRLLVRNHPGAMSHICGLFARRAFNVEGIICLPMAGAARSLILLEVAAEGRIDQVLHQLEKLNDVLEVRIAPEGAGVLARVADILRGC